MVINSYILIFQWFSKVVNLVTVLLYLLVIEGKKSFFSGVDWRYNEFPNPAAHVLHCTCIEIMALPAVASVAGSSLLDVVIHGRAMMNSKESSIEDMEAWMNAAGLILVSLPDPYWLVLHDRLVSTVENLKVWSHAGCPLTLFNFKATYNGHLYHEYASLLAITHAVNGFLSMLYRFKKTKFILNDILVLCFRFGIILGVVICITFKSAFFFQYYCFAF